MRILLINPNSDAAMTDAIRRKAESFANGEYEVVAVSTPGASKFVATYEDHAKAAPGMVDIVRRNQDAFDAFVIACHGDPNMDLMKEITNKPVVGIAEASMKIATMLGHSFTVIAPVEHNVPNKWALIRKYHLSDDCASVRAPKHGATGTEEEKLIEVGRRALAEDMAEVLVLGCAGFAELDKRMERELGVPVLDGVVCALIVATGLVKYGVSISKQRRYNPVF